MEHVTTTTNDEQTTTNDYRAKYLSRCSNACRVASVCVFSSAPTHVVVDIDGWFGPLGLARFAAQVPQRLVDTRTTAAVGTNGTLTQSGSLVTVTGSLGSVTLKFDNSDTFTPTVVSDGASGTELIACFCGGIVVVAHQLVLELNRTNC